MDSRRPSRSHLKTTHPVLGPDTSRHPASGPGSTSPAPAREALLALLDTAIQALGLMGMEALAFALRSMDPASTVQDSFPPRASNHLTTSQALALAFAGQLSEHSSCRLMVAELYGIQTAFQHLGLSDEHLSLSDSAS